MSVQMLAAWNGLEQHQIYDLSAAEEARLVGLRLARAFTPGAAQGEIGAEVLVCDWQPGLGTLALTTAPSGTTAALDSSVLCDGLPTLKITLGASTGPVFVDYTYDTAIPLAQLISLQVPIRFSENNNAFQGANVVGLQFWDDTVGSNRQWRLATGLNASRLRTGVMHTLSFGPGAAADGWSFTGTSAPTNSADLDAFTVKRIRVALAVPSAAAGQSLNLGSIRANARRNPVLSLVLDGPYASQHTHILRMLEAQGLRCSIAVSTSTIGATGRMTAAQLDRAYGAGHEIMLRCANDAIFGDGYQSEANFPTLSSVVADIETGWAVMRSNGWTRGLGYLVHGGSVMSWAGTVTAARQALLAEAYRLAGVKAIRAGDANAAGPLNRLQNVARPRNVDPYTLQGALQWTNTHTAADLIAVATRAKARGEWGLITGHRSVVAAPGSLEMAEADIFTAVQSWGDDARASRLRFLPFGEACVFQGITV